MFMLRSLKHLKGYRLAARDKSLGEARMYDYYDRPVYWE
jgi:hypothetical protein